MSEENPLAINLTRLEEECADQPLLMKEWTEQLAIAKKASKVAKNNMKLIAAELGRAFRSDTRVNLGNKVTEASIEEYILMNSSYQSAQADLIEMEYNEDIIEGYVKSIVDRKDELRNEVLLHGQGYWSKVVTEMPVPSQLAREKAMDAIMTNIQAPKRKSKTL